MATEPSMQAFPAPSRATARPQAAPDSLGGPRVAPTQERASTGRTEAPVRIGSLCTGYGGLDSAVQAVFGGTTVWHADIDPGASAILAHHWPQVPNLGDISAVDWAHVEPVDILTAGFPCQDVSLAGKRAGLAEGTRSGLWTQVARAIHDLNPNLVVIENVRGLLSADAHGDVEPCTWCVGNQRDEPVLRALGAVLGDLADLGFDAEWIGIPASDPRIGAPHERWREFIAAWPAAEDPHRPAWSEWRTTAPRQAQSRGTRADAGGRGGVPATAATGDLSLMPTPAARDWKSGASNLMDRNSRPLNEFAVNLLPTPLASDGGLNRGSSAGWGLRDTSRKLDDQWIATDGTDYGPAIRRWENVTGRPAPCPTEPGARGNRRLSPLFTEWLMGLPEGHVTAVPGLDRRAQLHALGNGVVPQQAETALRLLAGRVEASMPSKRAAA